MDNIWSIKQKLIEKSDSLNENHLKKQSKDIRELLDKKGFCKESLTLYNIIKLILIYDIGACKYMWYGQQPANTYPHFKLMGYIDGDEDIHKNLKQKIQDIVKKYWSKNMQKPPQDDIYKFKYLSDRKVTLKEREENNIYNDDIWGCNIFSKMLKDLASKNINSSIKAFANLLLDNEENALLELFFESELFEVISSSRSFKISHNVSNITKSIIQNEKAERNSIIFYNYDDNDLSNYKNNPQEHQHQNGISVSAGIFGITVLFDEGADAINFSNRRHQNTFKISSDNKHFIFLPKKGKVYGEESHHRIIVPYDLEEMLKMFSKVWKTKDQNRFIELFFGEKVITRNENKLGGSLNAINNCLGQGLALVFLGEKNEKIDKKDEQQEIKKGLTQEEEEDDDDDETQAWIKKRRKVE